MYQQIKKDILEGFVFKAEEEGLDYAIENYSDDLESLSPEFSNAKQNLLEYKNKVKNIISQMIEESVEEGELDEEELSVFNSLR